MATPYGTLKWYTSGRELAPGGPELAKVDFAGDEPERVAEIYALPVSDVHHAVDYEHRRADESLAA